MSVVTLTTGCVVLVSIVLFLVFWSNGWCPNYQSTKKKFQSKHKKKRTVRFNPVIEGNKFERKAIKPSEFFENVVQESMLKNNENSSLLSKIHVTQIKNMNHEFAFMIRNVLTPLECKQLIQASEQTGFEQRKFSGKGDDSSSCCFKSNSLANKVIFQRIKQHLIKKSYFDADSSLTLKELTYFTDGGDATQTIECFGMLECLNDSCRVEKYKSNQHLKIHRDGCVLVRAYEGQQDVYTIYAILVYLNNDFDDGSTRFCVDIDVNGGTNKEYPYSFLDVKGNVGDCLVFRHEILHKGGSVTDGTKYILRLDAAYKLIKPTV